MHDVEADAQVDALRQPERRTRVVVGLILGGALLLLLGFGSGRLSIAEPAAPSSTSAEAGFARDMQIHHRQAAQMSVIVRGRSSDDVIRQLALDVQTTQTQQAGQMYGWLVSWGLPQYSADPRMTWISLPTLDRAASGKASALDVRGMSMAGGDMLGLASEEDIEELEQLSGLAADRLYLELMIDHHRGGVEMAQAVLARSANPLITTLASSIVSAQQSEISYMEDLLVARS